MVGSRVRKKNKKNYSVFFFHFSSLSSEALRIFFKNFYDPFLNYLPLKISSIDFNMKISTIGANFFYMAPNPDDKNDPLRIT